MKSLALAVVLLLSLAACGQSGPPAAPAHLDGAVQVVDGQTWLVDGQVVVVGTQESATTGDQVSIDGTRGAAGQLLAQEVQVAPKAAPAIPTAAPTVVPPATKPEPSRPAPARGKAKNEHGHD